MPYVMEKNTGKCSASKPFAVMKQAAPGKPGGDVVPGGCHATKGEALAHMRALYANVPDARANADVIAIIDAEIARAQREEASQVYTELARSFSAEKRRQLAQQGKALPDGSFPIENCQDVENAVEDASRGDAAEDKIKAHIVKNAKALGCTGRLPADWQS